MNMNGGTSTTDPRTRLIAIANPNNPTGAAVSCEHLLQVAQAAPQAAVLVDEAYFEFHGETIINQTIVNEIVNERMLPRFSTAAEYWSRNFELSACAIGRAAPILCSCASAPATRTSFKLCARAEFWCGTEIPILDAKAACA